MTNVTPIYQSIEFSDVMTTGEVARLLRRSLPTVRALAGRSWHPLPAINTGTGGRKQRLFLRSSVLSWMKEEEAIPVEPVAKAPHRAAS